jgi:predicted ATPase
MTALFQQSWQQLTDHEQHVFASLSIFYGGFQREAAEKVAGASNPKTNPFLR